MQCIYAQCTKVYAKLYISSLGVNADYIMQEVVRRSKFNATGTKSYCCKGKHAINAWKTSLVPRLPPAFLHGEEPGYEAMEN